MTARRRMRLACLSLATAAALSAVPAQARAGGADGQGDVRVGDAHVHADGACSWTMGTAAMRKRVALQDGRFELTSFRNELTSPPQEYVSPGSASEEFDLQWDGTPLSGASGGWSCAGGSARVVREGGAAAIRVRVALSGHGLGVTKRYVVYPHESLIREWTTYRNADGEVHRLSRPSFMAQHVKGDRVDATDLLYMRGGRAVPGSYDLEREQLSPAYSRTFDSYDRFGCTGGTQAVWRDMGSYAASGHGGQPEWHDGSGGWVWPAGQNPGPANDTARTWTAPRGGTVDISGHIAMRQFQGNGSEVSITVGDRVVWGPRVIAGDDRDGFDARVDGLDVKAGDVIRFVTGPNGDYAYDDVGWDPTIAYRGGESSTASQDFSGTQGQGGWRYQDRIGGGACPKDAWAESSSVYMPWFALWDRDRHDGVFMGFDYYGRWSAPVGAPDGDPIGLSLDIPNYDSPLQPGQSLTSPKAFAGVYAGDLDDMTNRLLDWQYRYLWDYARKPFVNGVRMLGDWCAGSQWCGSWDQAGTLQKVFGLADHLRSIGADVYHRDNGWWDRPGDWNGPDFGLSHDYLAKSGMGQLMYMMAYDANTGSAIALQHPEWWTTPSPCGYADRLVDLTQPGAERWMGDLLIGKASAWGDYQWRNDSCPVGPWTGARQLGQDQAFRRVQRRFLDARPGSAIMGVDSGGNDISFDFVRMASSFQSSDMPGLDLQENASRLFPVAKFGGMPDAWAPGACDKGYDALLSFTPDFTGDTADPQAIACMRGLVDRFHYLEHEGVAGRWVRQYHPHATDADDNWFERLSADTHRGVVIYKGTGASTPVTVTPKGLDPDATYDVRYELAGGSSRRTGRELMADGVTLPSIARGEIVWLGMPGHPGAGTDRTAPRAPARVRATPGTNMGWTGVEVNWSQARDDNWISSYQVLRDGAVVGTVAKGHYFFDHGAGASAAARYAVRAVDGDGNRSAAGTAPPSPHARVSVADDAGKAIAYAGAWRHDAGLPEASGGTLSRAQSSCHMACQGFSGTQGANGWRYQDATGGTWHDMAAYRPSGTNGMPEWHDEQPATGGYVWPIGEHPGPTAEAARAWTAPRDGVVDITSHVAKLSNTNGNGVVVRILRGDQTIWGPRTIAGDDLEGVDANVDGVAVSKGDVIRFAVANNGDWAYDWTAWDPDLRYEDDPPPDDTTPSATYAFDGSEITWFAKLGPAAGFAQVSIDGVPDATVDLYAPDENNWSIPVYRRSLPPGHHTITVTATGRQDARSTGSEVNVDGFQAATDAPAVVEDSDRALRYAGSGWTSGREDGASGGAVHVTHRTGDAVELSFVGRRFTWIGRTCPGCGEAEIQVDGRDAGRVDTYGYRGPDVRRAVVWDQGLRPGRHTVRIVATGRHNLDATGADVVVDAIAVRR